MRLFPALRRAALCRLALLATVLALAAPAAYGRAGGGHSYSGGRGGGFGRSSWGGSSRSYRGGYRGAYRRGPGLIDLYLLLLSKHPLVGWPVTLFALYIAFLLWSEGNARLVDNKIVRGAAAQKTSEMHGQLGQLKARDPAFNENGFLERVGNAFLRVQAAWCAHDMKPTRGLLSDGVHERFSIYIAMQQAMGIRNNMDELRILETKIVQVHSTPHFDTVHVGIRAKAIDTDVALKDGAIVRNRARTIESFVEVWSFLRRPGAKTLGKPGLMEGCCPNCGSPLQIADAARCQACQSWVNSGEHDWVLAEITQACEWSIRDPNRDVPGLGEIKARDQSLSIQFLEDRASVIFWRWQIAHWEPQAQSLKSVAADAFTARFIGGQDRMRNMYRNGAVGGVDVLALESGKENDRAHILVKWSAEHFFIKNGNAEAQGSVEFHHVFILGRKSGAASNPNRGLRSLTCTGCGSPPENRHCVQCGYCGTRFNDGSRSWILLDVVPRGRWRSPAAAGAAAVNGAPAGDWDAEIAPGQSLAILIGAMLADGHIDERELAFARDYADKHEIPARRLHRMVAAARSGQLQLPAPKSVEEAKAFLRGVVQMSLADGKISKGERNTLLAFGRRLRMPPAQIEAMIEAERKALYQKYRKGPIS